MTKTKKELFVEFNYKELKDLGKHFLTISSASMVFVLTFFEKINPIKEDKSVVIEFELKIGGTLLVASVICCGIGLFTNYIAGAGAADSMMWKIGKNYRFFTKATYILYVLAGGTLICGYLTLLYLVGAK